MSPLPCVSMKDLQTDAGRAQLVKAVGAAAETTGFFQVIDHGIPTQLLEDLFKVAQNFFALPLHEKMALKKHPFTNRGYQVLGGQTLQGLVAGGRENATKLLGYGGGSDLKEGFVSGTKNYDEKSPSFGKYLHGPNFYPPEERVPRMREITETYFDEAHRVAQTLIKVYAAALDQREDFFAEATTNPVSIIRLLHYPSQKLESQQETLRLGAGAHTDFGLTTILATKGVPGLEVWMDDQWIVAEPAENALIVNVGDCLSAWTGGRFKSSLHRVINRSGKDRYSVPYFMEGNLEAVVRPLKAADGSQSEAFSIEQHIKSRYIGSHSADTASKPEA